LNQLLKIFFVVCSIFIVAFVVVVVVLELDKLVEIEKKLSFVVAVGFGNWNNRLFELKSSRNEAREHEDH
jgi:hypothetical protein